MTSVTLPETVIIYLTCDVNFGKTHDSIDTKRNDFLPWGDGFDIKSDNAIT